MLNRYNVVASTDMLDPYTGETVKSGTVINVILWDGVAPYVTLENTTLELEQ
jgi:hypothetical protein